MTNSLHWLEIRDSSGNVLGDPTLLLQIEDSGVSLYPVLASCLSRANSILLTTNSQSFLARSLTLNVLIMNSSAVVPQASLPELQYNSYLIPTNKHTPIILNAKPTPNPFFTSTTSFPPYLSIPQPPHTPSLLSIFTLLLPFLHSHLLSLSPIASYLPFPFLPPFTTPLSPSYPQNKMVNPPLPPHNPPSALSPFNPTVWYDVDWSHLDWSTFLHRRVHWRGADMGYIWDCIRSGDGINYTEEHRRVLMGRGASIAYRMLPFASLSF